jgi:hypothetical protein
VDAYLDARSLAFRLKAMNLLQEEIFEPSDGLIAEMSTFWFASETANLWKLIAKAVQKIPAKAPDLKQPGVAGGDNPLLAREDEGLPLVEVTSELEPGIMHMRDRQLTFDLNGCETMEEAERRVMYVCDKHREALKDAEREMSYFTI